VTPLLASLLGAGAGLLLGLVDYVVLGRAGDTARRDGTRGAGSIVALMRVLQLLLLPVAGWFLGPLVASNLAG